MTPSLLFTSLYIADAATTSKDRWISPPWDGGEWKVKRATWVPDVAATLDATEYRVLALKNGSTTLASASTASAAWVAGTPVNLTPSGGGKNAEFTGGTDAVEVDSAANGATSRAANGHLFVTWERIS